MGCCEDYVTCDIAFNAVMPLSRASTRGRYGRIEGATHYLPFASRFPLPHFTLAVLFALSLSLYLPLFARFSLAMSEPKRIGGSLPSFSTLDNPSILAKLINNDTMEKPTGVIDENLNNLDEDDSGIFCYLLDESWKDAWYRLLRIRASYVPQ